ncbi:hypothetical protein [Fodinicola feengrottensis]|uniref:hypothetical protein n=1 Tax=Fodinicola feengrottensis TaxID=435914 RepID=UPI002442EE02|nr:hypothetical protein [Fodinicola feengrottensis]
MPAVAWNDRTGVPRNVNAQALRSLQENVDTGTAQQQTRLQVDRRRRPQGECRQLGDPLGYPRPVDMLQQLQTNASGAGVDARVVGC